MAPRFRAAVILTAMFTASSHSSESLQHWKPVSFAILEDYDKGQDLADVQKDFTLFRELGITTWRGSFGWDDYEPARAHYDFTWLHQFADLAARNGITLRPYVGYAPEWAGRHGKDGKDKDSWNDPPAHLDEWKDFVSQLARAMSRHKNVASFEIYNEENVQQWWEGDASEYSQVLAAATGAVHDNDVRARVLFGGMVYPDPQWVQSVCAASAASRKFDVLPFHAYPETWTPPDVTVENYLGGMKGFLTAADAACGAKPVWINETGFATVSGRTEQDQANWWMRAVATFVAEPRIEHIGVYEIKDLAPDTPAIGEVPNYHLGITRVDRTKKLAFSTVQMLARLFNAGRVAVADDALQSDGRSCAGAELHRHLFARPDGTRVLSVWTKTHGCGISLHTGEFIRSAVEYRSDGHAVPFTDLNGDELRGVTLVAGSPRIFLLRR